MVQAPQPIHVAPRRRASSVDKAMATRRSTTSGNNNADGGVPPPKHGGPPNRREKQVGQFVLGKTLGEGTFGEVKLAMHKPTSERVAAKVLEKTRIKTIADVKRVSREIKILKRVKHPNVIALYEVLDTPSTIYFMMEHCDGGELFDYIVRHQRLQEGQACFFFRQLVDGIDYLHKHDVTHRDLKPENLLLQSSDDGWRLKIIDFGLSNTHEGGKLLQTACGSPCYAAPEMIAGESYRGPAADVWSCGVVLFTLVAGFLPFEDPNTSALYKKILSGSYEKPNWLSDGAIHLLSRILHTDPAKRADVSEIRRNGWYVGAHPPAVRPKVTPFPAVPSRRSHIDDRLLSRAIALAGPGGGGNGGGGGGRGTTGEAAATEVEGAAAGLLSGRHDPVGTAYNLLLKRTLRERSAIEASAGEGRCRRNREADRRHSEAPRQSATAIATASATAVVATAEKAMAQASSSETSSVAQRVEHTWNTRGEEHCGERGGVGKKNGNAPVFQRGASEADQGTAPAAETAAPATRAAAPAAAETARKQQPPSTGSKAPGVITPRVIHGNSSYASSTSSSRSGQQQPLSTAAAPRRDRAGGVKATAATNTAAGGSANSSSNSGQKARSQQQEARPQTPATSSDPTPSAGAIGSPVQEPVQARSQGGGQGGRNADARKDGDGTRVAALVEKHANTSEVAGGGAGGGLGGVRVGGRGRDAGVTEGHHGGGRAGNAITPNRPVPTLSFRGISRNGGVEKIVGRHDGKSPRPSSSAAFFVSQTARARTNGGGTVESQALTDHNPATQQAAAPLATAHQRSSSRESSCGGSSSSGGSAGGGWNTMVTGGGGGGGGGRGRSTALPRRPLTARAPLRSSAPTPRLSGDFSLARPRGAPAAANTSVARGASSPIAATGRTVSKGSKGRISIGGAPLAAEPVAPAAAGASPTPTAAAARTPIRARQQQPSLRVRLSNLSSNPAISQQQQQQQRQRLELSARKGEGGGRGGATAEVTVGQSDADSSLRQTPRCPSFPISTPATSTAAATATAIVVTAAAASAPREGAAAARTFWGKHQHAHSPPGEDRDDGRGSGQGLPPGIVAIRAPPHASTSAVKSWARGDGRRASYPRALQT